MLGLPFGKELPMSGNNTKNYCEAQFLVIADEVLNRQEEVNIVNTLENNDDPYKSKLLSVASEKFGGVYSLTFKGV